MCVHMYPSLIWLHIASCNIGTRENPFCILVHYNKYFLHALYGNKTYFFPLLSRVSRAYNKVIDCEFRDPSRV